MITESKQELFTITLDGLRHEYMIHILEVTHIDDNGIRIIK